MNYHSQVTKSSKNRQELLNLNKERDRYLDALKVPSHMLLVSCKGGGSEAVTTQWRADHLVQVISEGQVDTVCLQM